ncbi:MAG: helix-turn-helix transcriptional regulator [Ruminococcaceae bacterium]|nr:helix-turn-helix transcriptional regulator [Oscillospiraceae bacterium]
MSESICQFIPAKDYNGNIKTIHFVYETEFHKQRQPFFYSIYRLHLVTEGSATLKTVTSTFEVKKGDLFFAFPASLYEMVGSNDFQYCYISFMGVGITKLFEELQIKMESPVYYNYEHLIDFWYGAINRITPQNSIILTESVLLYTLSFLGKQKEKNRSTENLFEMMVDYIDKHYMDCNISLMQLADLFSYTEKYLSHLFKKNMNQSFKTYLNNLRIQYACELIENNNTSIAQISALCGYSDSLYFSKVFKKFKGMTPREYIKSNTE